MIDAAYGKVSNVVALPGGRFAAGVAVQGRDIWVANPAARTLDRLSPPYTAVAGRVPLPSRAQLVAAGGEALWAVGGRQLWRIDPGHGRVTARVALSFAPRALAARLDTLMIDSSSCAAAFTQIAAIEALGSPESEHAVHRMVKVFEHRRNLVVDGINEIPGMRCARPQGSFYAFPNIEGTGFDEHELADRLLDEAGVAVLPGTAFGDGGKGFIRLAYTQSEDELKLGLRRIKEFVAANKK